MRQCLALLLCLLSASLPAAALRADDALPMRRIGMQKSGNTLLVSFSYRDAFTAAVQQKLTSGLKTSIVVQLTVWRKGSSKPLAFWARTVEITYDLWEERYYVLRDDASGRRRAKVFTKADAIELSAVLVQTPIGPIADMGPGLYRVQAKIETNPVSREMVERIRSWLGRSRAKKSDSMATSNYFGSFVGAMVDRRISQAEHTIEFVSQWFRLRQE